MVKILFRCEHCFSYYESKTRTKECCKDIQKDGDTVISKFTGQLDKVEQIGRKRRPYGNCKDGKRCWFTLPNGQRSNKCIYCGRKYS